MSEICEEISYYDRNDIAEVSPEDRLSTLEWMLNFIDMDELNQFDLRERFLLLRNFLAQNISYLFNEIDWTEQREEDMKQAELPNGTLNYIQEYNLSLMSLSGIFKNFYVSADINVPKISFEEVQMLENVMIDLCITPSFEDGSIDFDGLFAVIQSQVRQLTLVKDFIDIRIQEYELTPIDIIMSLEQSLGRLKSQTIKNIENLSNEGLDVLALAFENLQIQLTKYIQAYNRMERV